MYRAIYRKWRPRRFADVIGQPHITVTLLNQLRADRVAHAFLFTGCRGTGKTTCAKILAKAVNCLSPNDGEPCCECEVCRGIDNGSIPDVAEIDAASNNGVDNIRQLREEAWFTPAVAKYRVYIIDEVHMLSAGAWGALLKILEEPPTHVKFILATTEVHKVPATILSRCQRFDFHRVTPECIAERLSEVVTKEGGVIEPDAAMLIARLADGAVRDALSILEQCFGHGNRITENVVEKAAGLTGRDHLFELTDAILSQDAPGALEIIDRLHKQAKDMARLTDEMILHFRNLMLLKTVRDGRNLMVATNAEYQRLVEQTSEIKLARILPALNILEETAEKIVRSRNPRVDVEMAVVRLSTAREDTTPPVQKSETVASPAAIISANNASSPPCDSDETVPVIKKAAPAAPVDQSRQPYTPAQQTAPAEEESEGEAVLFDKWAEVLDQLQRRSPALFHVLAGSSAYVRGSLILIDAPHEMAFSMLRDSANKDFVRVAVRDVTGEVYRLGPYKKTALPADSPLETLLRTAKEAGVEVYEKT